MISPLLATFSLLSRLPAGTVIKETMKYCVDEIGETTSRLLSRFI